MSDEKKIQGDFDKLFDELFANKDKKKDSSKSDDSQEEFDEDFFNSIFGDDKKESIDEEIKLDTKKDENEDSQNKDNNEDENFDWLKDLIDEIDREEQAKKQQETALPPALPVKPNKPSFTSKLKDKPRPPRPPEHVAKYGTQKRVIMPVRDDSPTNKNRFNSHKLHIVYTVIICCILFTLSIFLYKRFYLSEDKFCNDTNIIMKHVYSGDKILLDTHEISENGKEVVKQGYIDAHISNLMYQLVKPGEKVIDVGAGFGYYTLYLARIVGDQGKVYSFEARKNIFELLESSILINRFKNVETLNKVLFSDNTNIIIDRYDNQKRSNFGVANIVLENENIYDNYEHKDIVQTVTLDSMFNDIKNISMLNINAHGSELSIILGAKNLIASSPKIKIITTWSKYKMAKYVNLQSVVTQLLDNGFRFWLIKPSNGNLVELTQLDHIMQVERGRFLIAKILN